MEINYSVPEFEVYELLVLDSNPKDYYNQGNYYIPFNLGTVSVEDSKILYE